MRGGVRQRGREFGHYEVFEELGQGGIGEAYVARPTRGEHAGTFVCLKIMGREFQAAKGSRRREAIASLRHEARVVSQLHHPNIARLLDSGAYNDVWFLAFELIEGAHLGEILALQPPGVGLAPEHVRRIGLEVAAALQCAHEDDVLHRDIKPSNILVGTSGQVKLVDFGLAKANARHAADFTVGIGTPRYWAPEQIREEALSAQTDIYALGIVLYELLTTVHPFDADDPVEFRRSVLRGTLRHGLRELGIPEDLGNVVERCLKSKPSERFPSAAALQEALRSGAKASGFEYDMGELATVAREAIAEARVLAMDDSAHVGGVGERDETLLPDVHGQDTRHEPRRALAETVRDGIPGGMSQHVRDEVMSDLSKLAQRAFRQRQSHTAQRQTADEAHPDTSDIRPSEPPTIPRGMRPQLEPLTARRWPRRGVRREIPAPYPPVATDAPAEANPQPAHAAHASPKGRVTRWAVAAGASIVAVVVGLLSLRADREPDSSRRNEPTTARPAPVPTPVQPAAPAATDRADEQRRMTQQAALHEPRAAEPPATPGADRKAPIALDPASIVEAEASVPSEPAGARDAIRRTNARAAHERIEVTIGLIPYGEVIVDGRKAGQAPVTLKLSPGTHRIVGRYQKLRRVQTVVVAPDTRHFVLDLRDAESQE